MTGPRVLRSPFVEEGKVITASGDVHPDGRSRILVPMSTSDEAIAKLEAGIAEVDERNERAAAMLRIWSRLAPGGSDAG